MTTALSLEMGRRAPLGGEELRRQLLALVLACVLVWYTLVVPAGTFTPSRPVYDDEGHDGEVRGVKPQGVKSDSERVEDLDWPEYIYP
ncbi:MAG: hypothetical protein JOZ02_10675 [Acidobacteria bacterium]|nr:hypothetical protein [Acidobacteriota bacterium]